MTPRLPWLLVVLLAGATGCSKSLPEVAPTLADAELHQAGVRDDLWSHLARYAGESPRDCGQHVFRAAFERIEAEELERAVECARTAAARPEAFVAFEQYQGIDSTVVQGLVAGEDGVTFRFLYDSAPCGNPRDCPPRFTVDRCPQPTVVTERYGGPTLYCER